MEAVSALCSPAVFVVWYFTVFIQALFFPCFFVRLTNSSRETGLKCVGLVGSVLLFGMNLIVGVLNSRVKYPVDSGW